LGTARSRAIVPGHLRLFPIMKLDRKTRVHMSLFKDRYTDRYRPRRTFPRRLVFISLCASIVGLILVSGGIYVYHRTKQRPKITEKRPQPPSSAKVESEIEVGIALPSAFGGKIRSKSLVKLLDAVHKNDLNPSHLHLSLEARGKNHTPTFPVGEPFKVKISSPSDCYYAVIHRNSDGTFELLVPKLASDSDAKLKKGVTQELSVHTTPPGGQQEFLLIGAEKPIDLESLLSAPPETFKHSFSAVAFPYVAPEK